MNLDLLQEVKLPLINTEYLLNVIAQEELIRTNLTCRDLLDEAKVYIFKRANILVNKSPMGPKIIPRKTAAGQYRLIVYEMYIGYSFNVVS